MSRANRESAALHFPAARLHFLPDLGLFQGQNRVSAKVQPYTSERECTPSALSLSSAAIDHLAALSLHSLPPTAALSVEIDRPDGTSQ